MIRATTLILMPSGSRPQQLDVVGLHVQHHQEQAERQGDQHDAGEPAFGRQGLHLAEDLEALADDVADLVEDFGQVAAGLPLDGHAGHEEPQVEVRHAVAHALAAPPRAGCRGSAPRRRGRTRRRSATAFPRRRRACRRRAVAGPQGPGDQLQGVGQLGGELLQPRCAACASSHSNGSANKISAADRGRRRSCTPISAAAASRRPAPAPTPMPNSVLGLMLASACSKILLQVQEVRASAPPAAIFLSRLEAPACRSMSVGASSFVCLADRAGRAASAVLPAVVAEDEGQHADQRRRRRRTTSDGDHQRSHGVSPRQCSVARSSVSLSSRLGESTTATISRLNRAAARAPGTGSTAA